MDQINLDKHQVEVEKVGQCKYCGRQHEPRQCPAYGQECRKCKKKHHWAACCKSKAINKTSSYDYLVETISKDGIDDATEALVVISINHKDVRVKLDTGAEVDVMLKSVWSSNLTSEDKFKTTTLKLHEWWRQHTYTWINANEVQV